MENTYAPEDNVVQSFRRVKADVIKLQDEFMLLRENQIRLIERLSRLESERAAPKTEIVRVIEKPVPKVKQKVIRSKTVKTAYLASKDGTKFHDPGCNSLKKVSRDNLVSYSTKYKAISKGLQPCGMCIPR